MYPNWFQDFELALKIMNFGIEKVLKIIEFDLLHYGETLNILIKSIFLYRCTVPSSGTREPGTLT